MQDDLEFPVMMSQCFWCGQNGDEILIGRRAVKKQPNRPRMTFVGYEPCTKCKSEFEQGIRFIEAVEKPRFDKQPEIQRGAYPTGRVAVIREEAVDNIFDGNIVAQIKEHRVALLNPETFSVLFDDFLNNKTNSSENQEETQ
jgi:hypothetical protein